MLTRIFALLAIMCYGTMAIAFTVGINVIEAYPTMGTASILSGMALAIPATMSMLFAMESHQFGSINA